MPPNISRDVRPRIRRLKEDEAPDRAKRQAPVLEPNDAYRASSDVGRRIKHDKRPQADPSEDWQIEPAGNRSLGYVVGKRLLDVIVASALLALLSPILLATLVVLMVTTQRRPIFCQERVGCLGRRFCLYKFRTMVVNAETIRPLVQNEHQGPIFKNRTDPRITRIGRILRRTSIDELPQLFNVLRGEMSLVGPRPPLATEVAQYEPWQRVRLAVKPGLTCLWQVSGRSEIGFEQWMRMDQWYVHHQNLITDLLLLLRTPWAVLSRRGAF